MIQVAPNPEALARAAAEAFARRAVAAVQARGRFSVALSGGSTPRRLYELLADEKEPFRTFAEIQAIIEKENPDDERKEALWEALYLTCSEVEEFLAYTKENGTLPWVYPMVTFAAFTGAPVGKVFATTVWGSSSLWTLTALPLFIWMGEILFRTRLSEEMFRGLAPWLTRVPGRLVHINVLGCGLFAAVCGSSAATAAIRSLRSVNSRRVPTSGIMISGWTRIPLRIAATAASKIARTCMSQISG